MNKTNSSRRRSKDNHKHMKKPASIVILTLFIIMLILGSVFAFVSLDEGQLGIVNYNAYATNIKLGLDVKGGVYAVFDVDKKDFEKNKYVGDPEGLDAAFDAAVEGTVSRLTELLVREGYTEAQVTVSGSTEDKKIRVEVPDVDDPDEIFDLISKPATLTMYEVTQGSDGSYQKVDPDADPYITGSDIESANVAQNEGKYVVSLKFNKEGTKKFSDATSQLQGKLLGIFIDGECIMAPKVNDPITDGQAVIEGDFTYEQAREYAVKIQSGALQVKLSVDSSSVISASLGKDAVKHGLIAGGVGLLIIMAILIARYRMLGVAASISLIYFTITYLFIMSIFPWVQLTLPGIAGILLTIGMAVDANVIIFERVREIHSNGGDRSIRASIKQSFSQSLSAIIDGNVTTIIGGIVLAIIAVSSIKAFAMTLLIGIIISLFSSLVVTRLIINCFLALNESSKTLYGLNLKEVKYNIDYKSDDENVGKKKIKKSKKTNNEDVNNNTMEVLA